MDRKRAYVSPRTQGGASLIAIVLGIVVLLSAITMILRLGPHYIDWQTMKTVIDTLPATEVNSMTKSEIRETLKKRFRINSLRNFDLREIVLIERSKEGTSLVVEYERREPVIGNVDVILSFREQYQYR